MKNAATRDPRARARIAAHLAFDRLWRDGYMTKGAAYAWLATVVRLPPARAHIGHLSVGQCRKVIAAAGRKLRRLVTARRGAP